MPRLTDNRVNCVCGGSYLSSNRSRHMRSCTGARPHTGGVINASEHE